MKLLQLVAVDAQPCARRIAAEQALELEALGAEVEVRALGAETIKELNVDGEYYVTAWQNSPHAWLEDDSEMLKNWSESFDTTEVVDLSAGLLNSTTVYNTTEEMIDVATNPLQTDANDLDGDLEVFDEDPGDD